MVCDFGSYLPVSAYTNFALAGKGSLANVIGQFVC